MLSETFGKHLIAARVSRGFTQKQLAASCQLHQSVISAIEKGRRWPSVPQMMQLALVLQVPLQDS
jgi:transcriptional regulator with XRE-family HTH domain